MKFENAWSYTTIPSYLHTVRREWFLDVRSLQNSRLRVCVRLCVLPQSESRKTVTFTGDVSYGATRGAPKGGGGCRASAPPKPLKTEIKKKDFVAIMISEFLRDFPFSRNQPLKSADD
jgi:hypothetical protein